MMRMVKMMMYRKCFVLATMMLMMTLVYVSLTLTVRSLLLGEPSDLGTGMESAVQWRLAVAELRKERGHLEKLAAQLGVKRNNTTIGRQHGVQPRGSSQGRQPLEREREDARRKVENTAVELWYYANAKMDELRTAAKDAQLQGMIRNAQADLKGYQLTMMNNLLSLRQIGGDELWRRKESFRLGDLVQRRLQYLQNPKDCLAAKVVRCELHQACGLGCELTEAMYCLVVAYATKRTLVLSGQEWGYGYWNSTFMPVSHTCKDDNTGTMAQWGEPSEQVDNARVLTLPPAHLISPRPDFLPLAIPEDLAGRLTTFHGDAPVWWLGQMVRFLMRPNADMEKEIEEAAKNMGFQRPIVGVHIRRTDKIFQHEASYHSLEEYMKHVIWYYDQKDHRETIGPRRVYLATDDPSVLTEARRKYPEFQFISDTNISRAAFQTARYSDASLRGIVLDIHFLAMTDFIVCTFSSGVCRVAYELMQTRHGDASTYFRSLDDGFYFHGSNPHNWKAVEPHDPGQAGNQLPLRVGDLLHVAGNHWNGYSKATHVKTGRVGLFPSYKAASQVVSAKMPIYPEVPENENETGEKWDRTEGLGAEGGHR